jgi:ribonucleoside-diphosphate reductase alpha chain
MAERYAEYFPTFIKRGVQAELLDEKLQQFDLKPSWAPRSTPTRDLQFDYLGLQTLYDRYFLHTTTCASKCRRRSSCAWPWAWR